MPADTSIFSYQDAELVLALVGAVGTEFDKFIETLGTALKAFNYQSNTISLSKLAARFKPEDEPPSGSAEYVRLTRLMNAGNAARARRSDTLALAAAAQINAERPMREVEQAPRPRTAHIIRSLKHPDEVQTLRRIYGSGFFLIGVLSTKEERSTYLQGRKGCTVEETRKLLQRDASEDLEFGQQMRETFHLADVFVGLDETTALKRFLRLVFGDPYQTPSPDEYAMFMAFSAALRSADLSRQVGAVVMSSRGDVVSVGTNDVPTAGGGLCWPGENDQRDHVLHEDTNEKQRSAIIDEILGKLAPEQADLSRWLEDGRRKLKNARVMDITEYGRAVHAEMEALLACARSGISPREGTLYSTTFPCHNCAKHIIAAGISKVVYVQPYPKSQAVEMYPKAIHVEGNAVAGGVAFEPFRGVSARRFFDLFSVGLSSGYPVKRKEKGGNSRDWTPSTAEVRAPMLPNSYIKREQIAAQKLVESTSEENAS